VPLNEMQNLRLCLELAAHNPSHLERGVATAADRLLLPEPAAAVAPPADASEGLVSFQLHPKKADGTQRYTGLDKFKHLAKMARRSTQSVQEPSSYLDVEISPDQRTLLNPSPTDYMMGAIVAACHGDGAKKVPA